MSDSSSDNSASRAVAREAEFGAFHTQHFGGLSEYVTRRSRGRVEGDDTASAALLEVYETWDAVPPERRNAWVYTIARNKMVDELRKEETRNKALRLLRNSRRDAWQPDLGQRLEVEQSWAAIDRLPRKQREAMLLHAAGELPEEDIAALMNVDVPTVRTYLGRARRRIRDIVGNTERRQRSTSSNQPGVTTEGRIP